MSATLPLIATKVFKGVCQVSLPMPERIDGLAGWGQAEIGVLAHNCGALVLQQAVAFDLSDIDSVDGRVLNRAILSFDEAEAPECLFLNTDPARCWQRGDKVPEHKPNGCVDVKIPQVDWVQSPPVGLMPTIAAGGPKTIRINGHTWDVTEAVRWQTILGTAPLNSSSGHGFLLSGALLLDRLTGDDNAMCVSKLSNIKLEVTFTVPKNQERFRNPR